jgi:hypothetical protein
MPPSATIRAGKLRERDTRATTGVALNYSRDALCAKAENKRNWLGEKAAKTQECGWEKRPAKQKQQAND